MRVGLLGVRVGGGRGEGVSAGMMREREVWLVLLRVIGGVRVGLLGARVGGGRGEGVSVGMMRGRCGRWG